MDWSLVFVIIITVIAIGAFCILGVNFWLEQEAKKNGIIPTGVSSEKEYVELVEVFSSLNAEQVMFVKSLLGGSGIKFVAQGDNNITRSSFMGALSIPVRFLVPVNQVEDAKALLKEL